MRTGSNKYLFWATVFLFTGVSLHLVFLYGIDRQDLYAQKIGRKISRTLAEIEANHDLIESYLSERKSIIFSNLHTKTDHSLYIFKDQKMIYWSNDLYYPSDTISGNKEGIHFINQDDRKFLVVIRETGSKDQPFRIMSLISLYKRYDISNEYLESGYNPNYFESSELNLYAQEDFTPVYGPEKQILFYAEFLPGYVIGQQWFTFLTFLIITAGILLMIWWLVLKSGQIITRGNLVYGLGTIILGLIIIRISILLFGFPFPYLNFNLFDPRYYASSFLNPSLGDVCINMLFLFLIIWMSFRHYYHRELIILLDKRSKKRDWILGIPTLVLFFLSSFFIFKLLESLSTHSQWSLDISSGISFSVFRWISFLLFIVAVLIYVLFTYFLNKIIGRIFKGKTYKLLFISGIVLILYFIVGFGQGGFNYLMVGFITLVFILFSYWISIRTIFVRLRYKTFVYILASFIFTSLIGTLAINKVRYNQQEIRVERFGEQLVQENDPITEYFLAEAIHQIQNDVFIKNRLHSPFVSKEIIEEKIRRVYLNNYLDKYEINIFLFNIQGKALTPGIQAGYYNIRDRFARPQFQTEYEELYFILIEQPNLKKRYLGFIPISQYNTEIGYVILDLQLKKVIPTKVYPRLLLDDRFSNTYFDDEYDYALFKNNRLINSSGNFSYETDFNKNLLENDKLFKESVVHNKYKHYGFLSDGGKVFVISHPVYSWISFFANFSFLFILLSFCLLIMLIVYAIYFNIKGTEINYVTRIQLYLNLAFFIPLTVISVSTLTRSTSDYKQEIEEEYLRKAESTSNNITGYLQNFISNISSIEELSSKLSELADFSELDMDIFRIIKNEGRLLVSTQPLIYDKDILSELIDPVALAGITERGEKSMIRNKEIGSLAYKTAFVAIRSPNDGNLIGILSIPFFGSQETIDENLTGLFINILSIFTIIFISFVILSFFVSNYLTFPLKFLTDRLRRTTLTGLNEPIQYVSSDEIGQLVNEYNNMILKLEESKKALAQSEKEAAWREMAKQVAHEIKNPLTPMKLTLQHMRMRVSGDEEEKARLEKSINSLLHNIETLSDIATSFSNYAQMPVPEREQFDIVGLLKQSVNIYMSSEDNVDIQVDLPKEEIMIEGDPGWIGRTFSNLIINGIQAVEKGFDPKLKINLEYYEAGKIVIQMADNGKGIPEEIRDKIFMPNFSTKYSGSGIGLAIAKRAVEHAGGKIWFDTEIGKGTVFYIELPVVS